MTNQPSVLVRISDTMRNVGSALSGLVPPLRSAKGLFGTQRAESAELAERRAQYPSDQRR